MAIIRYKNRPITPCDAVVWNGTNFEEIQTLCPEATLQGTMVIIPTPGGGFDEVYPSQWVMHEPSTLRYLSMDNEVFIALYTPQ